MSEWVPLRGGRAVVVGGRAAGRRGRAVCSLCVVAELCKPEVEVPSDQAPSYQLELEDITVGEGEEAVAGSVVEVHYVGVSWRTGKEFDASWNRGSTFKFGLGK